MKNIKIGKKIIGNKKKCLVVAEISAKHDSKLSNAVKLIKLNVQKT